LRHIHWPATAHRGRLAVLEHELELGRELTVFLDLERRSLRGLGKRSTLEVSVEIAAGVAALALERGDSVQLIAEGSRPARVPRGAGTRHLAWILEALAGVRSDGETSLESLLVASASEVRSGSTVVSVLASASLAIGTRSAALATLRARGCELVCILLDESTFHPMFREQQKPAWAPRATLASAAAVLAREGSTVFTVAQGDDLAERLVVPHELAHGRQP
jgi:uncharacterized protein (DUF58 family)